MKFIPLLISLFTQNAFAATPFANTIEAGYLSAQLEAHQHVSAAFTQSNASKFESQNESNDNAEVDDTTLSEPGDALAARRNKEGEALLNNKDQVIKTLQKK